MAELSARLNKIAEMVKPCDCVADIGCDHGLLSAYMVKSGKAQRVIAADIGKGPLSRCVELVEREGLTDSIDVRLSDGFAAISSEDAVDAAVIAGMGGPLGLIILYKGRDVVSKMKQVVLGLQSDFPMCYYTLSKWGFTAQRTEIIEDEGKFYYLLSLIPPTDFADFTTEDMEELMKANKEELVKLPTSEAVKYYFPTPTDAGNGFFIPYLKATKNRLTEIAGRITCNSGEVGTQRLDEVKRELSMVEMLL